MKRNKGGEMSEGLDHLFEPTKSAELDAMRQEARTKRRITYDCFNTTVAGDRVVCSKGYPMGSSKDGSMLLISVLAGRSCKVCQDCSVYDAEEED